MVTIDNIPNIIDVNRLIDLLDNLGVTVKKLNQNKYSFESKNIDLDYLNTSDFETKAKGLRGSIMIIDHYYPDLVKHQYQSLGVIKLVEES